MHLHLVVTLLSLFAILAAGAPYPSFEQGPLKLHGPYNLTMPWNYAAFVNGTTAGATNPFNLTMPFNYTFPFTNGTAITPINNTFTKRTYTNLPRADVLRCSPYNGVIGGYVQDGIEYLRKVPGHPHLPAGPKRCERVSCSYNTGIFWCNDNDTPRTLPSFNNIADGAQVIFTWCGKGKHDLFSGELSHDDKWRAVVERSRC
ncbi:hypothetical protein BJX61DRAFT_543515 [Aspergillus egyptiacus]|nr:hypothetical protein BJX61DRAFT_543515 [Aspergillus egyptiacus]